MQNRGSRPRLEGLTGCSKTNSTRFSIDIATTFGEAIPSGQVVEDAVGKLWGVCDIFVGNRV